MLVHIADQLKDRCYLFYTGASFSLIPHKSTKSTDPPAKEPCLIGPNGFRISCWGEEQRQLIFSGPTFEWTFLWADVSFPILGVDFLWANWLFVSVASNQLHGGRHHRWHFQHNKAAQQLHCLCDAACKQWNFPS